MIGTGGGAGTLTVGPAALTALSVKSAGLARAKGPFSREARLALAPHRWDERRVGLVNRSREWQRHGDRHDGQPKWFNQPHGQGATLKAGNTLILAAGSTASLGAGTSFLTGGASGQGLDVGNGGTLSSI